MPLGLAYTAALFNSCLDQVLIRMGGCLTAWVWQGWVDAEEAEVPSYEDIVGVHDDEDEAYDEQADQFEAAYNFRFEVSIAVQTCCLHRV